MEGTLFCGSHVLSLRYPLIMGIVNTTDDSFSGDGHGSDLRRAIAHGRQLAAEGAHLLDIGGESSRPGAQPVSAAQEIARVVPVVEALRGCGLPLSVDTTKPEVMRAAIAAGADMINDIHALRTPGALEVVAASQAAVCLMHMQGDPRTMQDEPHYGDVVAEVADFLAERVATAEEAGIPLQRIIVDPGFGFGKSFEHNLELLQRLDELCMPGLPVLVGMSRKSMIGLMTGKPADQRLAGGIAAAMLALRRGASILRVHDVAAIRDAVAVWNAVEAGSTGNES